MERKHLRVFVACGTGLPFVRLLQAANTLVDDPAIELFVQRGPGVEDYRRLPGAALISRVEFAQRLIWCDAYVTHAGAGSLYEGFRAGLHPIAMARLARHGEHVNDHQLELLGALQRRGLASELELPAALPVMVRSAPERVSARNADELSARLAGAVGRALLESSSAPSRRAVGLVRLGREMSARMQRKLYASFRQY